MPGPPVLRPYLHPAADAELAEAVRYYEGQESGLGARFEAEFVRCVRLIEKGPGAAPVVRPSGIRRKLLQGFPYSIVFAVETERIRILAIAHQSRRPTYWADRV